MVTVCMTTIHSKLNLAMQAIESFKKQTYRDFNLILYVSREPYLLDTGINFDIHLQDPRMQVQWVKNIGPYRKFMPFLLQNLHTAKIFITVDDDAVYSPDFLKVMLDLHNTHKCCISFRGHTPASLDPASFVYYNKGERIPKHVKNFHTGAGGVLFSCEWFRPAQPYFDLWTLIPTEDDVFLNVIRQKMGIPCYVHANYRWCKTHVAPEGKSLCKVFNTNDTTTHNYKMMWGRIPMLASD